MQQQAVHFLHSHGQVFHRLGIQQFSQFRIILRPLYIRISRTVDNGVNALPGHQRTNGRKICNIQLINIGEKPILLARWHCDGRS